MKSRLITLLTFFASITAPAQEVNGSDPIDFADAKVKEICVANWDTNGDGELSYDEAAAVTELGEVFRESKITSFNELRYFTGLTSIGDEAFYNCYMTSITIPENVNSIGNDAFYGCDNITSITVVANNPVYDSRNDCNAIIETASNTLIVGFRNTEIPESVTSIGQKAFYYRYLTSITIPSSVTNIGYRAFSGCSHLTSITVAANNPVYDSRNDCNAIIETASNTLIAGCMNTTIPESVTIIGGGAFQYCTQLKSITIPESVTTIGGGAFASCI